MKAEIRYNFLAVVAVAALAMSITGCKPEEQPKQKVKSASRVVTTAVEQARMQELLHTTGEVRAMNTVMLQATVEGPITFCPWREGDRIQSAGERLIEISRPLYNQELASAEASLAVAQARLEDLEAGARPEEIAQARETVRHLEGSAEFARIDLERIHKLVESETLAAEVEEKARVDYIKFNSQYKAAKEKLDMLEAGATKTEIAVLRAAVAKERANRDLVQEKINECLIKAPFAGVVTEVFVRPGDLATPRLPLLKMIDESSLIVRSGLPEHSAINLAEGTAAEITLDAYPEKTFKAVVERVHPRIETSSRTRIVEFKITDKVGLLPHMFARVSVQGRVIEKAVRIPSRAIVATPRGDMIVFVVEQGKAVRRKVITGLEQNDYVQIIEGIQPGEMVVIEGNLNLKDGQAVNAVQTSAEPESDKEDS